MDAPMPAPFGFTDSNLAQTYRAPSLTQGTPPERSAASA
jgi:hypothetical protein